LSLQTVARRYAAALADVVTARGEEKEVKEELSQWVSMLSANASLQEVFRNPTIPLEQKQRILNELILRTKVRQITANFLQVLLRNHRLTELGEINKRFSQVIDERSGIVAAHVTAARALPEKSKRALYEKLVALTGKDVRLSFAMDQELIGGIVTRVGSTVYDGSVRNQLEQFEERLAGE
jgi:F-type H+-transporting ATPase subunit delta